MLESLKVHPILYIIVLALTYFAGGATMFAAIWTYVIKTEIQSGLPGASRHKHVMDVNADRDKIAEALQVIV